MLEYDPRNWYWNVLSNPGFVYSSLAGAFVPEDNQTYQNWVAAGGHTTRIANAAELGAVLAQHQVRPTDVDVLDGYRDELARNIASRPNFRLDFNKENRIRAIERALSLNGSPPNLTMVQYIAVVKAMM